MRYTHLLFDADGTLLDFDSAERDALQYTLDEFRIPYATDYNRIYHDTNAAWWKRYERGEVDKKELAVGRFRDFFQIIGVNDTDPQLFSETYMNYLSQGNRMLDGAADVVTKLSLRCRLYIITNGTAFIQRRRWSAVPQNALFADVFISDEIGARKPSIEYFDHVLAALGDVDKCNILVIGDSLTSDIAGGVNAGLDTCWYNPDNLPLPEGSPQPTYTISTLYDLIPLIARGNVEDSCSTDSSEFCTLSTHELERERNFYTSYLGGVSGEINRNLRSGFSSCFITFFDDSSIELVSLPVLGAELEDNSSPAGWSQVTVAVSDSKQLNSIIDQLRRDGYVIISAPYVSGSHIFARILDPDGNMITLRAKN